MAGIGNFDHIDSATCGIEGLREIRGCISGEGWRFAIVASRFNQDLTTALARTAVEVLVSAGVRLENIDVVWVPGAFEIPSVLEPLAAAGTYRGLIAFGAVVQGETVHAQTIGRTVSAAISAIARDHTLPVIDGLVVAPDRASAEARCLSASEGRGAYAAQAAMEMAQVFDRLPMAKGSS